MKFGRVTFNKVEGPREIADFVGPGRMKFGRVTFNKSRVPAKSQISLGLAE
jgi:hypothetical protein